MSKFENDHPFMPWNNNMDEDNPFKPWNHPMYEDDPFAPWNNPLDSLNDYEKYCDSHNISKRDR